MDAGLLKHLEGEAEERSSHEKSNPKDDVLGEVYGCVRDVGLREGLHIWGTLTDSHLVRPHYADRRHQKSKQGKNSTTEPEINAVIRVFGFDRCCGLLSRCHCDELSIHLYIMVHIYQSESRTQVCSFF